MLKKLLIIFSVLLAFSGCSNTESITPATYKVVEKPNYDLSLYENDGEDYLITESVKSITKDLDKNFTLQIIASVPGSIYFASYLPESDNQKSGLYKYNPETKKIDKIRDLSVYFMQLNDPGTKLLFADIITNSIHTYDFILNKETLIEKLPESKFLTNPTVDGLSDNTFAKLEWKDNNTASYSLYNTDGTTTQSEFVVK